jgi:hypothetical protein
LGSRLVSAGAAWDLFDHRASRSKQFARNDKPKRFRGPQIDGERERGRLLHRQDYAEDQGNYSRVLLSAEWGSAVRLQSSNLGALMPSNWGIGSRTQWDVTKTFYLGVEVLYENLHSAQTGTGSVVSPAGIASFASGGAAVNESHASNWMVSVRAHRDFLP